MQAGSFGEALGWPCAKYWRLIEDAVAVRIVYSSDGCGGETIACFHIWSKANCGMPCMASVIHFHNAFSRPGAWWWCFTDNYYALRGVVLEGCAGWSLAMLSSSQYECDCSTGSDFICKKWSIFGSKIEPFSSGIYLRALLFTIPETTARTYSAYQLKSVYISALIKSFIYISTSPNNSLAANTRHLQYIYHGLFHEREAVWFKRVESFFFLGEARLAIHFPFCAEFNNKRIS